jgi:hypothetical protein
VRKARQIGGFSLPLASLVSSKRFISGWFVLLPESEAKTGCDYCGSSEAPDLSSSGSVWDPDTLEPPSTPVGTAQAGAVALGQCNEDVVARYSYAAAQKDELSFDVGDVIHVSEKRPSGWWAGYV